jgi:N-acetylglucosamine-6-sulfatase
MPDISRRTAAQLLAAAATVSSPARLHAATASTSSRPNIILVIVDDLRWDEFGLAGHPYLETPNIDRIGREGVMFTQAIHATPLCSPNRANILTGQFASRHGIIGNEARDELSHRLKTFPIALNQAGYRTGHIGKWHMGNDPTPRPGFDYWVSFPGQGKIIDPELYEDGALKTTRGYVTDLLSDRAVGFVRESAKGEAPFFLNLAHKAIHPDLIQRNDGSIDIGHGVRFIPAARHEGRYKDKIFPRRRNYLSPMKLAVGNGMMRHILERKDSPAEFAKWHDLLDLSTSEATIREREEMLLSIDEGLGRLFAELDAAGKLDETVIILTSDNGYFYGEHGLSVERRMPYEEGILSPLLIRYPPVIRPGSKIETLVSSIDIAPTILELAKAPIGAHVQGCSFLSALHAPRAGTRDQAYIEYNGDEAWDWVDDAAYRAIRTNRYKLIHWVQHPEYNELYDLKNDPFEETNILQDSKYTKIAESLRASLGRLTLEAMGLA